MHRPFKIGENVQRKLTVGAILDDSKELQKGTKGIVL